MTTFWSAWIIFLTLFTIAAITALLFANRKTRSGEKDASTGHAYDGIDEYDNPMPAWWMYMFVISIVFGLGYLLMYPGLGNFPGLLGWTQENQLEKDIAKAEKKYGPLFAKYAAMPVAEVMQHPEALKMGRRIFANNCSQCHGTDAKGAMGFPNLTDNDWLYGGEPEQIQQTLINGRNAAMPPWQDSLKDQGINEVTAYLLSLNDREADPELVKAGETHFKTFCIACHGPDAKGNQAMGAPNLTDDIWLYGGSPLMIKQTLRSGRNGRMPSFQKVLSEDKIHLLNAYVSSLSKEG